MNTSSTSSAPQYGGLISRMGIEIETVSPERVTARMPVAGNTQPMGLLHGGASAVLAETVGSIGALAHAPEGHVAVGVDLNITHVRAVSEGEVRAVATAIHLGRSIATYVIEISDGLGHIVSNARLTCHIKKLR